MYLFFSKFIRILGFLEIVKIIITEVGLFEMLDMLDSKW